MYPWGAPPRVSSRGPCAPRDLAPPITFSERTCKSPRALEGSHSSLFSVAVQDGELAAVNCVVLRTNHDLIRHVEVVVSPPNGQGMSARPVPSLWVEGVAGFGENAAVGSPRGPEPGPGSPSPKNGG